MAHVEMQLLSRVVRTGCLQEVIDWGLTTDDFRSTEGKGLFVSIMGYYRAEQTQGAVPGPMLFKQYYPTFEFCDDASMTVGALCTEVRRHRIAAETKRVMIEATEEIDVDPVGAAAELTRRMTALSTLGLGATAGTWDKKVVHVTEDWLTTQPAPREWLLVDQRTGKPALPVGEACSIVAAGGAGKTMLVLQLALAIATGGDWLGTYAVDRVGPVLLVLGEEDVAEVKRRVFAAGAALGKAFMSAMATGRITILPLKGEACAMLESTGKGNSTTETAFLAWLRNYLTTHADPTEPWALIVLDPLSRFAGPLAETLNHEATHFVQVAESLCTLTGATVLVSHHTNQLSRNKDGELTATSGRGVTGLVDAFRWQASLGAQLEADGVGEVVTLSFSKSNYGPRGQSLALKRGPSGVLLPLDGSEATLVAAADPKLRKAKLRAEKKETKSLELQREEHAVIDILSQYPNGLLELELRGKLSARLGRTVGRDKLTSIVARLDGEVVREDGGRNNAKLYMLKGTSDLPDEEPGDHDEDPDDDDVEEGAEGFAEGHC